MSAPQIEVVGVLGEYRLVHGQCVLGGQEYYGGSDVLALGDEVLESLAAESIAACDSVGFVFSDRFAANAARARIVNAVLRFRGEP